MTAPKSITFTQPSQDVSANDKVDATETITITVPSRLEWVSPPITIQQHETYSVTFSVRVTCLTDGSHFDNEVFVTSDQGGKSTVEQTNIDLQLDLNQPSLANGATWCSDDAGGTFDLDWGDFDLDGDLDLALSGVASIGARVYRNQGNGEFDLFSVNKISDALTVRWADVDTSNQELELIVGGDFNRTSGRGQNYIYGWDNDQFTQKNTFESEDQLWRIAPADYNKDGLVDLAAANFYDVCLVRLYKNDGGQFEPDECMLGVLEEEAFWEGNGVYSTTRSIAWIDQEGDGFQDLLLGNYGEPNQVYKNMSGTLSTTPANLGTHISNTTSLAWFDRSERDKSIPMQDEGMLRYVLPFTFAYFTETNVIEAICVNTNGLVELISLDESCTAIEDAPTPTDTTPDPGTVLLPSKPITMDTIYAAYNTDLVTGVIIETGPELENKDEDREWVEITWIGTTKSGNFLTNPLAFKVFIFKGSGDGAIVRWKFYDMGFSTDFSNGDPKPFSGLHIAQNNAQHEIPGGSYDKSILKSPAKRAFEVQIPTEPPSIPDRIITTLPWNDFDTSIPIADDVKTDYILPGSFDFSFFGQNKTKLCVTTNGMVELPRTIDCPRGSGLNAYARKVHRDTQADVLYAANDDLVTGVIIERGPEDPTSTTGRDKVSITWMGSTYKDYITYGSQAFTQNQLAFKLIIFSDTDIIRWKFFDFNYDGTTTGSLFSGAYYANWPQPFGNCGFFISFPCPARYDDHEFRLPNSTFRGLGVNRIFALNQFFIQPQILNFSLHFLNPVQQGIALLAEGIEGSPYVRIYKRPSNTLAWSQDLTGQNDNTTSVAWGDYNSDGNPDLAAGGETNVYIYQNNGESLNDTPNFTLTGPATDLAWGDFNGNNQDDLAVGHNNNNRLYKNNSPGSPIEVTPSPQNSDARSVAWADIDNDGKDDLALGNFNQPLQLYRGTNSNLVLVNEFSPAGMATKSVAWNDFDGDGDFDLAVGNNGRNQIYVNRDPESPWLYAQAFWTSKEADNTSSIAWADFDKDGDDDLAVGNEGAPPQIYRNRLFSKTDPLTTTDPIRLGWVNDLAWGDYNNDGWLDLAIGGVDLEAPGGGFIRVFASTNGHLEAASGNTILSSTPLQVHDLAWGDYGRDGYLDLAVGFKSPTTPTVEPGEVRVYRNMAGTLETPPTHSFSTVGQPVVDWVDPDGDGLLDLAVASKNINILRNDGHQFNNTNPSAPGIDAIVRAEALRAGDYDNDGDVDVAIGDLYNNSILYTAIGSHLSHTVTVVQPITGSSSVAWGDVNRDGHLDLIFGSQENEFGQSRIYLNQLDGSFAKGPIFDQNGFGPQPTSFGDMDGDGILDIAFGTPGPNSVYRGDGASSPTFVSGWRSPAPDLGTKDIAWGYIDDDDQLDLLVANDGPNLVFMNQGSQLSNTPVWSSTEAENTRSIAWSDMDNDRYLDFVAGNYNQPSRIYRNNKDNKFSPIWQTDRSFQTTSVAWADYDRDGDLDLAIGNYEQPNYIYRNQNGVLASTPIWTATNLDGVNFLSRTVSLAWGDWDNDGDPDLAFGNEDEPDQVYENITQVGGRPQFLLLWSSQEKQQTTQVAWGDADNDGDLDLAVSQGGSNAKNGYYENIFIKASHLKKDFADTLPLPNNPTYLSLVRPGQTDSAYDFSSPEILTSTIEFTFTVYDPNGSRKTGTYAQGHRIQKIVYEYSLDGGHTWAAASIAPMDSITPTRKGNSYTFIWDAGLDKVSDNARFRVKLRPPNPVQRANFSAVSPPFRIRALADNCIWPDDPFFTVFTGDDDKVEVNETLRFLGGVIQGSNILTFTWDFGDGTTGTGQSIEHKYTRNGTYLVRMLVLGPGSGCISQQVGVSNRVVVGTGISDKLIYFPLVQKQVTSTQTTIRDISLLPMQVMGIQGSASVEQGITELQWQPNAPAETITEYRIYRRARTDRGPFQHLATVPGDVTRFTDQTAGCGQMYYVTAVNARGESPPSTASYFSLPCR